MQNSENIKAGGRSLCQSDPGKVNAVARASYHADPGKKKAAVSPVEEKYCCTIEVMQAVGSIPSHYMIIWELLGRWGSEVFSCPLSPLLTCTFLHPYIYNL